MQHKVSEVFFGNWGAIETRQGPLQTLIRVETFRCFRYIDTQCLYVCGWSFGPHSTYSAECWADQNGEAIPVASRCRKKM